MDTDQSLLSIDQLSPRALRAIFASADRIFAGELPQLSVFSACLIVLQPSLRTRLGFAVAIEKLGGRVQVITELRATPEASASESLWDTLRVASGIVDLMVVRTGLSLPDYRSACTVPVISAGDSCEHPTQAIGDLFSMERLQGPIDSLAIGVCGDLSMRAARSLLKGLALLPPRRLRLIAPPNRLGDALHLTSRIQCRVETCFEPAWEELDVVYMVGLPERRGTEFLDAAMRSRFSLHPSNVLRLGERASVLSPMPIIDEIEESLRRDPRVHAYRQSDLCMATRMAVIARILERKS